MRAKIVNGQPRAAAGVVTGRVRIDHLITHTAPFTAAREIFAMIQRGGTDWLGVVFAWDK